MPSGLPRGISESARRGWGPAASGKKMADTSIKIVDSRNAEAIARLLRRSARPDRAFERRVRAIVDRVQASGDRALFGFAKRFDGVHPPLEVTPDEMRAAAAQLDPAVRRAIRDAARNIARVAFQQIPRHLDLTVLPGVSVEQRVEPLARVGCYVPGGRFPLPSSLLMTAVPARVAGVREIVVVCPKPDASVMAAALEARVTKLFRAGGAHAIAALAYGTATVPRVDKIVGPGNRYVAVAKALVSGTCAIDFYAGPTEIVIVAGSGRASWIASDLVAQAGDDPGERSIMVTCRRSLAARVAREVAGQRIGRPIVERSLASNGAIVVARSAQVRWMWPMSSRPYNWA